ncbi:MAG: toll/interleukin-1 receptor domain-containing protein [Clostridiales bacterium]|nr:toll/interleukin-1 receptor domain-containing protein [Clostridiales bacterium]
MKEKYEIFLSYCWADEAVANNIEEELKKNNKINLHRDKIDIGSWGSIKEYMQSIGKMDYTILLISDAYLKSSNCMYEVLEVMRNRDYKEKIFPAVIDSRIYKPATRAEYVKYWQNEYEKLNESLKGIFMQNMGNLGNDLKRAQDIAANMAMFLEKISDLNNPNIKNVCMAIETKLREKRFIEDISNVENTKRTRPIAFENYDIFPQGGRKQASDFEKKQFLMQNFKQVNSMMFELSEQLKQQDSRFQVIIEQNDTRTCIYQFYKEGKLIRNLKIFLNQDFGANIGISTDMYWGNGGSWNGMYTVEEVEGYLYFTSKLSFTGNQEKMTAEDVVKDIWKTYVRQYLR